MVIIQYAKRGYVMNRFQKVLYTFIFGAIVASSSILFGPVNPPMDANERAMTEQFGAMPPMSAEEQALAQQLDSVFTELTKGMSDQEKDQFYAELNTAMEEEIDKMSKMSETDLNDYIQKAENELKSWGTWPEPSREPIAEPAQPKPTEKGTDKEEPKKAEKPARDMGPTVDDIIAHIESFMTKISKMPGMDRFMEKWGAKGTIRNWNKNITWSAFKEKVDALKKSLYAIKSVDPKTQKAKHMIELGDQEALCNNLTKLRKNLATRESSIQVPPPPKKVSKESKASIKVVIGDLLEATHTLNIAQELDKIIGKFDPTAKKIKEAQEQAAKQAEMEYRKLPAYARQAAVASTSKPEVGTYVHGGFEGAPTAPAGFGAYQAQPREPESAIKPTKKGGPEKGGGKKGGEKKDAGKTVTTQKKEAKPATDVEKAALQSLAKLQSDINTNLQEIETLMVSETFEPSNVKIEKVKPTPQFLRAINELELSVAQLTTKVKTAHGTMGALNSEQKKESVTAIQKEWKVYKDDFLDFPNSLK